MLYKKGGDKVNQPVLRKKKSFRNRVLGWGKQVNNSYDAKTQVQITSCFRGISLMVKD